MLLSYNQPGSPVLQALSPLPAGQIMVALKTFDSGSLYHPDAHRRTPVSVHLEAGLSVHTARQQSRIASQAEHTMAGTNVAASMPLIARTRLSGCCAHASSCEPTPQTGGWQTYEWR